MSVICSSRAKKSGDKIDKMTTKDMQEIIKSSISLKKELQKYPMEDRRKRETLCKIMQLRQNLVSVSPLPASVQIDYSPVQKTFFAYHGESIDPKRIAKKPVDLDNLLYKGIKMSKFFDHQIKALRKFNMKITDDNDILETVVYNPRFDKFGFFLHESTDQVFFISYRVKSTGRVTTVIKKELSITFKSSESNASKTKAIRTKLPRGYITLF